MDKILYWISLTFIFVNGSVLAVTSSPLPSPSPSSCSASQPCADMGYPGTTVQDLTFPCVYSSYALDTPVLVDARIPYPLLCPMYTIGVFTCGVRCSYKVSCRAALDTNTSTCSPGFALSTSKSCPSSYGYYELPQEEHLTTFAVQGKFRSTNPEVSLLVNVCNARMQSLLSTALNKCKLSLKAVPFIPPEVEGQNATMKGAAKCCK